MKTKFVWWAALVVCLFTEQLHAGAGALDPTFYPTLNGPVYSTVIQPDNRILIAGAFTTINNVSRGRIARLYVDGSVDVSFLANNVGTVWAMTQQLDGRIMIGGEFTGHVARLNIDGTPDRTFNSSNVISTATIYAVAVQPDGKILVGGTQNYIPNRSLWRFNADGSLDTNFASGLSINGTVYAIAVQWDGKILVGGSFSSSSYGLTRNNIMRLEPDGIPDVTFPNTSSYYGASGAVRSIVVQPDQRILLGGDFTSINNYTMPRLGRLNSDGSTDFGFNYQSIYGASSTVYCLALQNNSSVVAGGAFTSYNGISRSHLVRTFPDGTLDNSFLSTQSTISANVRTVAVQNDGKVIIGGEFTSINGTNRSFLARLYGDLYPPEIITQPLSRSTNVGASVTFTVNANNPTPVNYQWRKNGSDIPGATLNSYQLFNVQLADSGSYSAFLSDGVGGTNSSNAVLSVGILPSITNQPASLVVTQGQSAIFNVGATGTSLSYQWKKFSSPIAGATNASYTIANAKATDAASYSVSVSNFLGNVPSSQARLTVISPPVITDQPASSTIGEGTFALITVGATGTSLTYQWYKDGAAITNTSGGTDAAFPIINAQFTDAGDYFVIISNILNVVTSQVATITVQRFPPVIVTQPAGQNAAVGTAVQFFVEATGTTLNYQWKKDDVEISGATDPIYERTNVLFADAGSYTVVISNPLNVITSSIAILNVGYPPAFTNQPVSVTNVIGGTVMFSADVDGTQPIQLLWLLNGNPLFDQTNATLTVTNIQTNNVGTYVLTATNLYGGTVSSNATLTIFVPPVTAQFDGQARSLFISGPPNATCIVEQTFSLVAPVDWQPASTNVISDSGRWTFVDTNRLNEMEVYYRVTVRD